VKYLVEEGKAAVEIALNNVETPHYVASHDGKLEVAKFLVEEGKPEVGKATNDGETPLHIAKSKGYEGIVRNLKEKGRRTKGWEEKEKRKKHEVVCVV